MRSLHILNQKTTCCYLRAYISPIILTVNGIIHLHILRLSGWVPNEFAGVVDVKYITNNYIKTNECYYSRAGLGFDSKYKIGAIVNLYIILRP